MIPVGTKVSPEARIKGLRICELKEFSEYDMLQMFYDVAIRLMDPGCELSYDHDLLIQLMDGMKDWKTSIRLTDPEAMMRIQEAFYVLTEQGRTGTRMMLVQGDANDMFRTETYNVQDIVERFISLTMPSVYRRLRQLGIDLGTNSVYETLLRIVDEYKTNPDADELRLLFADNDWHEGHKMSDQRKTKGTRINNPTLFQ